MSGRRPKKSLGQNFLIDKNIARKIVQQLVLRPDDTVLEIGPGQGALTQFIYGQVEEFIALEKDWQLASDLKKKWPELRLINTDALLFPWAKLKGVKQLKIIGNLPYNVASPIMWDLFSQLTTFKLAVFMVQKEVGLRLVAKPKNKAYGALSVWVQNFVQPKILFVVSPNVFFPRPKVDSAVLSFEPKKVFLSNVQAQKLARTVKLLFQLRRKQLGRILRTYWNERIKFWFEEQGVSPKSRPEDLSPDQFKSLAQVIF
ncbi:16S rRNA (adenine(1518)-N(6)/adenine(1519)-N(6))-dimethyltransferase RsmA [Desulfovulcanus sp.]